MTISTSPIRVLVVDDHDLVRHGIVSLLDMDEGVDVIADASSGEAALEICRERSDIQIVLMDINMPGIGGMEATHRISKSWPDIGIIISMHGDGPLPRILLNGGASGYLTKGNTPEEMVNAIKDVNNGGQYIAKDIAQKLVIQLLPGEQDQIHKLSQRELQVMMMILQGIRTNEISDTLHLSPKTVSTYRKRLHEKLEVSSDIEMMHIAIKHGIIETASGSLNKVI